MKLFVWDYHGVLEQGNEISALKVTNLILKKNRYKERLTKKGALKLYGSKWYEYFEYILPKENHEQHLKLQQEGFDFTFSNPSFVAKFIKSNPHALKIIREIEKKHKQIIISNTNPKSLVLYLKITNIHKEFPKENIFAANAHSKDSKNSKKLILKKYLRDKNFEEIIIIGDSPSDMMLKGVGGGKTYLYCHPGSEHKNCTADYKINDLRELLKEI